MSVSEKNPNVYYYPEEDNLLGQHETSLNETKIEEIRDFTANCFCFCHIINSLLTELVRSVQEDTAGVVLLSLACGPRLRLGPKKRKNNSTVYGPLAQSITYLSANIVLSVKDAIHWYFLFSSTKRAPRNKYAVKLCISCLFQAHNRRYTEVPLSGATCPHFSMSNMRLTGQKAEQPASTASLLARKCR